MAWITAEQALSVLNVRAQTLYANVSRGKIRAKADDADPRRSLYHREDVLRMAGRTNGRRKIETVSAQAMQYGDPVLASSISTVVDGRLLYRGQDAATLAETATLEDIAALLWECDPSIMRFAHDEAAHALSASSITPAASTVAGTATASALGAGLMALARRGATDPPSMGRGADKALRAEAASIMLTLINAMVGPYSGTGTDTGPFQRTGPAAARPAPAGASVRLAQAWTCEPCKDLLRRTLVLLADHELNASTFATRVAISTGASLSAGVLAGFTTLTGPLHGGASAEFAQLIALAGQIGAADAIRRWLDGGRALPAFGHPLYPDGDPRAKALLALLPELQPYAELAIAAEALTGELPNIDFALSLLATACRLPKDAPFILFAVGRCVGWLAHALEQAQANRLIRPRARYTGPA
jgi:citrate synthase